MPPVTNIFFIRQLFQNILFQCRIKTSIFFAKASNSEFKKNKLFVISTSHICIGKLNNTSHFIYFCFFTSMKCKTVEYDNITWICIYNEFIFPVYLCL